MDINFKQNYLISPKSKPTNEVMIRRLPRLQRLLPLTSGSSITAKIEHYSSNTLMGPWSEEVWTASSDGANFERLFLHPNVFVLLRRVTSSSFKAYLSEIPRKGQFKFELQRYPSHVYVLSLFFSFSFLRKIATFFFFNL